MPSHTITITDGTRTNEIAIAPGETLLSALQVARWHLNAPCGGALRCGKCRVEVDPPEACEPADEQERKLLGRGKRGGEEIRLACRTIPLDNVTVIVPANTALGGPETGARRDSVAKGGSIEIAVSSRPAIVMEYLELPAPTIDDQRSVLRRVRDASSVGDPDLTADQLATAASAIEEGSPVCLIADVRSGQVIDLTIGDASDDRTIYGIAFDIGTTTVAGYLVDLGRHSLVATRSEANAQAGFGADVITRISHATEGTALTDEIRHQLARMVTELKREAKPDGAVHAVAIAGNTTMLHFLMGMGTASIARAPFMPVFTESLHPEPQELSLPLPSSAAVELLPGVTAYVGADIVADLLATRMQRMEGVSLLVDIGTNGEIVCGGRDGLVACSTAAGPAFEGATIRHGSGGIPGAIKHVRREGSSLILETIGGTNPASICGTGLMDIVAMLLNDKILETTGRLLSSQEAAALALSNEAAALYAQRLTSVDGEPAIAISEEIALTQGDIRQVQLAKGAIAAGIRVLLDESGVATSELAAVYLAGGFGSYVRAASAIRVGLLPELPVERVQAIGNAAGAGAARALVDRDADRESQEIIRSCRYVELSGSAAFQMLYMEEMMFPGAVST